MGEYFKEHTVINQGFLWSFRILCSSQNSKCQQCDEQISMWQTLDDKQTNMPHINMDGERPKRVKYNLDWSYLPVLVVVD